MILGAYLNPKQKQAVKLLTPQPSTEEQQRTHRKSTDTADTFGDPTLHLSTIISDDDANVKRKINTKVTTKYSYVPNAASNAQRVLVDNRDLRHFSDMQANFYLEDVELLYRFRFLGSSCCQIKQYTRRK